MKRTHAFARFALPATDKTPPAAVLESMGLAPAKHR